MEEPSTTTMTTTGRKDKIKPGRTSLPGLSLPGLNRRRRRDSGGGGGGPDPDAQHALRRADNLSTPSGQLAYKESASHGRQGVALELVVDADEDGPLVQTPTATGTPTQQQQQQQGFNRKGLRASITKGWAQVAQVGKLVRSKSLGLAGSGNNGGGSGGANGNARRAVPHRSFTAAAGARVQKKKDAAEVNGNQENGLEETTTEPAKDAPIAVDEESVIDTPVPLLLVEGTPMNKVTKKGQQATGVLRVDPELGQLIWQHKKRRIIPLESIKELRSGPAVRYYREQFAQPADNESRWLSIVYITEGEYSTLHLVAPTPHVFEIWNTTLQKLHAVRKELMSGLGNAVTREAIWAKQYWKAADEERDHKLVFAEVEKLCRRLSINLGRDELYRLFKQTDSHGREFLNFDDFLQFGKLLKFRPEIDRLYKKLKAKGNGALDFSVFEQFMREKQKSTLSQEEMRSIFEKYSAPIDLPDQNGHPPKDHTPPHPPNRHMTCRTFQAFLMSPSNSAFLDQHRPIWHDMTRPLSDYFISSSHNTYLVGNQLIGDSTIEGYIRALLSHCRSVEVDIYADPPSDPEPMITHGGTLTSKVKLRAVCEAIDKFGFGVGRSAYPIVISAEMHCTVAGQEEVARILVDVFGERLVRRGGGDGSEEDHGYPETIERLPSPEALKGKILFKTKNLNLVRPKSPVDESATNSALSSTTESSSSESEVVVSDAADIPSDTNATPTRIQRRKSARRRSGGEAVVASIRDDVLKAGTTLLHRMRSARRPGHQRSASHSVSSPPSSQPVIERPRASLSLPQPDLIPSISATPAENGASPETLYKPEQATNSISNVISSAAPSPPPKVGEGEASAELEVTLARRLSRVVRSASPTLDLLSPGLGAPKKVKNKMAPALAVCLVYTVGVKCRGINKKEVYAPEHMFSLSENAANRMMAPQAGSGGIGGGQSLAENGSGELVRRASTRSQSASGKSGMHDLIKHCRTHLVRIYPKGMRFSSSNYEPHRFWAAGAQLVAINWQTTDVGYMINNAMFQRNGRSGYVLKPAALRGPHADPHGSTPLALQKLSLKRLLNKRTRHFLDITIISAQQLPRPKDSNGIEIVDGAIDPYVEVSIHAPDWPPSRHASATTPPANGSSRKGPDGALAPPPMSFSTSASSVTSSSSKPPVYRTGTVKNNGFNPVWEEELRIPFECAGDMQDLIFVRFAVGQGDYKDDSDPLGVYCVSLGSLGHGYRHIPLHDTRLSQYLFSTLFVKISITDA